MARAGRSRPRGSSPPSSQSTSRPTSRGRAAPATSATASPTSRVRASSSATSRRRRWKRGSRSWPSGWLGSRPSIASTPRPKSSPRAASRSELDHAADGPGTLVAGLDSHLGLQPIEGHVRPEAHQIPAAELDRPELRVLEGIPLDVRAAWVALLEPAQDRELVLDRVLAQPLDEVVPLQTGLPLRAPELGRPGEDAEVVVEPVVRPALDRLFRVVLEVAEDGDGGVAG